MAKRGMEAGGLPRREKAKKATKRIGAKGVRKGAKKTPGVKVPRGKKVKTAASEGRKRRLIVSGRDGQKKKPKRGQENQIMDVKNTAGGETGLD